MNIKDVYKYNVMAIMDLSIKPESQTINIMFVENVSRSKDKATNVQLKTTTSKLSPSLPCCLTAHRIHNIPNPMSV